jgi:hypothetical protein
MGYVVKTFSGVSESSAYEKAAVAWCTTHCGPVIADDYLYGSSYDISNRERLSPNSQKQLDLFLAALENYQKVTGLDTTDIVDIQYYQGTNWWHFDVQLQLDLQNVTVLPDDVTMVHFKLMVS